MMNIVTNFICFSHLILATSSIFEYDDYDNRHNGSCYQDSECPSQMHCKLSDDGINLCICQSGYTFSHPFARCEPSKKIFRNFWIRGPTRIELTGEDVNFEIQFAKEEDQNQSRWQYNWIIQDGHEFAHFSGLNTSVLVLRKLTPGFILFGISITNESAYGFIPHNLTILRTSDMPHASLLQRSNYGENKPIVIVKNLTVVLPSKFAVLNASKSKNAVSFTWTLPDNMPANMINANSLHESELFLINLVSGRYFLNLTISNGVFDNTTVAEVTILEGLAELNSVEVLLKHDKTADFTYAHQKMLSKVIQQILSEQIGVGIEIEVNKINFDHINQMVQFIFHAIKCGSSAIEENILGAMEIVSILNRNSTFQRTFGILRIATHYCISSCSGHGICSNLTKNCVCEKYWMSDLIHIAIYGGQKVDCSWPVIVVWIFVLLCLLFIAKAVTVFWAKRENKMLTKSEQIKKLLVSFGNRKHLPGKFSPTNLIRRGKRRINSVKGVLHGFDTQLRLRNRTASIMDEGSDCYDEEEESSTE